MSRKAPQEKSGLAKKIESMYQNYGIDTSNMSDEEFDRICDLYRRQKEDIDADLKKSEEFKERFEDDIV